MSLRRKIYLVLWVLCGVAIMYLSLASIDDDNMKGLYEIPHIDKIVHFLMYGTLTTFGVSYLIIENKKKRWILIYVLFVITFGGLMELLQPFTARGKDMYDFFANTTGAIFATGVIYALRDVVALISRKTKR